MCDRPALFARCAGATEALGGARHGRVGLTIAGAARYRAPDDVRATTRTGRSLFVTAESRLRFLHRSRGALFAACAVAVLFANPAAAALYKWTDANGRVVYSDQPPAGNEKYEIVGGAAPPSNPNAVKDLAAKEAEFRKRQTDAAKAEKKSDAERVKQAKLNEMCERARANVRTLAAEQVALVRHNEKGEAVPVDDATRRRERVEVEAWIKANCGG